MEVFYMETIDLVYHFKSLYEGEILNTNLADQYDEIEQTNDLIIKGYFLIDFIFNDNNIQHEKVDFNFSLNKCKYHHKDLKLKIDDFQVEKNDNDITLKIIYLVSGDDVSLERFCLLDNDDITNELRDYLHRNEEEIKQMNIDENKIVLLDPVIKKEEIKVEVKNEPKPEIFKEKYSSSYLFYRVKKDDTLSSVAQKFKLNENDIIKLNPNKEIKENTLLQLPCITF